MSAVNEQKQVKYGELVLLGYNGHLPRGDRGRKRSKFILTKRSEPNGIKLSANSARNVFNLDNQNTTNHSITYAISSKMIVVAEYDKDDATDMFQIGRSGEASIDFVIIETSPKQKDSSESNYTISRFACRILVNRNNPQTARIFAAGFDETKNIFLGEKAITWKINDETMDGLTTNGVFILHPQGKFCGGDCQYGYWREVSVGGDIYSLRENRHSKQIGKKIETEDNVLKDGTLINLCGATLLWRSAEGLIVSPTKIDIERLVETINIDISPECATKVVIPRQLASISTELTPYAYVECGHVQCFRQSDVIERSEKTKCPSCLRPSSYIKLCMGLEPAVYVDCESLTYAFNPCGHMATEKTIKLWANVGIPNGVNGFISKCPFCAMPLNGWSGCVKLLFSS